MQHYYIALTGHRPTKLGGYGPSLLQNWVRENLRERIANAPGDMWGISGMALGADQWWAEELVRAGKPWIAAVPFVGQENAWPEASRRHYRDLLDLATETVVVSEGGYAAWKLQKRNVWMVDHSVELIAVYDGTPGGTRNCVEYAKKVGRIIDYIRPQDMMREEH